MRIQGVEMVVDKALVMVVSVVVVVVAVVLEMDIVGKPLKQLANIAPIL